VLQAERQRRESEAWELWRYWMTEQGFTKKSDLDHANSIDFRWLMNTLAYCPAVQIQNFMDVAIRKGLTRNLKYVGGCVRQWSEQSRAAQLSREQPVDQDEDEWRQARDAYERAKFIEEVLYQIREADHWRRALGYCPHDPECGGTLDCVQRQVRTWLGLDPNNRCRYE
jgi:hypothetical protein